MISHTNKFVYVHIPKVAGSSINDTLKDEYFERDNLTHPSLDPDNISFDPAPPHMRMSDYHKYGLLNQEQYNTYFKFTFVRNPWDRIVSEYRYRQYPRIFSFKEFIMHHLPVPSWSDEYCHIIPQYDFIYNMDGVIEVDFVGKFERIQSDFNIICDKLELPTKPLFHKNKSSKTFNLNTNIIENLRFIKSLINKNRRRNTFSHYTEYYDNESIDLIAHLYKNDINSFGYQFGE